MVVYGVATLLVIVEALLAKEGPRTHKKVPPNNLGVQAQQSGWVDHLGRPKRCASQPHVRSHTYSSVRS